LANIGINVKPIGIVHVELSDDEVKNSWFKGGVKGVVEVYPEYEDGLYGIEGFSHVLLVTWLHKVTDDQRRTLLVKPRRLVQLGFKLDELPLMGVFVCDSPHRPNPIGLTIVRLIERRGRFLYVDGLDLYDKTPVLDIRALTPEYCPDKLSVPGWFKELKNRVKEKTKRDLPI